MKISERRINMLRILYVDQGNLSNAKEIEDIYKQKFGSKIGNIYNELNSLLRLSLIEKNVENKTYQVSALGENILRSKGNVPEVQIIYKNVIVEKIPVYPVLYERIKFEARKEKQTVQQWLIGVLEILTDSKEEANEEEGNGDTKDNKESQM